MVDLLAKAYDDGKSFAVEEPNDEPPCDGEIISWFEDAVLNFRGTETAPEDLVTEGDWAHYHRDTFEAILDSWRAGYSDGLDSLD